MRDDDRQLAAAAEVEPGPQQAGRPPGRAVLDHAGGEQRVAGQDRAVHRRSQQHGPVARVQDRIRGQRRGLPPGHLDQPDHVGVEPADGVG